MGTKHFFKFAVAIAISLAATISTHADSIEPGYTESLETFRSSVFYADMVEASKTLERFPTHEAYEVVKTRIENLLDINPSALTTRTDFVEIVGLLLDMITKVGSRHDVQLVLEIHKWAFKEGLSEEILDKTTQTIEKLERIHNAKLMVVNPSVHERYSVASIDHRAALAEVEAIYNDMNREVKGQEEILRALADLYLKDLLTSGRRTAPEIFYFMGLPGNGKDTVVEAYVNALWKGSREALTDHLFRMNINNTHEAWSYFGSAKGYLGSTELPDFLKFLVEHSGGKYILAVTPEGRMVVEHNPDWRGENLPGKTPPNKAVIFINEAHNIPKAVKDTVLKQAIERGIFKINNPGNTPGSANTIELPVTFIFATNEGIDLLEPRQKNGTRVGAPLPYERLIENYDRVAPDKEVLKQAVLKSNGEINNPVAGNEAPGTSEEFLNRVPNHRIFIMKPLSPETLLEITNLVIRKTSDRVFEANGRLGQYHIEVTPELAKFITDYEYIPSENARPIKGRIESFIYNQFYEALRNEKIKPLGTLQSITVGLKKYANGVHAVVFEVTEFETQERYQFTRIIRETLKDRVNKPISDERIQEIAKMRDVILQNVFGVEHIVDALIEAAIVSESESRNKESSRPATVMAFLGMTSTGKTETAKQYVKARYGNKERPAIIDFNGIKTIEAIEAKILGSFDSRKNPIASDFMKAYDRANGEIAFIFDEAANAPKELLKALYEILRESVATGFSDGKARPMNKVTIILTGNAGEQIYRNIPTSLPSEIYERALHEVFRIFIQNEDLQRRLLTETFPEALLARLGKNIYHFGPLGHDGKRQVAQMKLLSGLIDLKAKPSEKGWNIGFKDEANLLRLFEMIEREGFNHNSQGASIDKFVREAIIDKIKARLLMEGVPSNQVVILSIAEKSTIRNEGDQKFNFRNITLNLEDGRSLEIEVPMGIKKTSLKNNRVDLVLTAFHEAGHEIVSEVFFGDRIRPKFLSIIEGVTIIGGSFVHYAGVRSGEHVEKVVLTKEAVLRHAAVFAAGYVAQSLVTIGGRHDAGKSDDMRRSTAIIQDAILRYGLVPEWGTRAIPEGVTTSDYIDKTLSDHEKIRLNEITNQWLAEAEQLAREALLVNAEKLFVNMSKEIAARGYINAEAILDLYEKNDLVTERDSQTYRERTLQIREVISQIDSALVDNKAEFIKRFQDISYKFENANEAYDFLIKKSLGLRGYITRSPWNKLTPFQQFTAAMYLTTKVHYETRDAVLSSDRWEPKEIANIEQIINEQREKQTRRVTRTADFKIFDSTLELPKVGSGGAGRCASYLN